MAASRRHGIICPVGECKPQAKHALSGIDTMFLSEHERYPKCELRKWYIVRETTGSRRLGRKGKWQIARSDCERIELIKKQKAPYFVRESKTGYVVIGDNQRIKRHSLFLCKQCVSELHLLAPEFRYGFLTEMSIAAEAVYKSV